MPTINAPYRECVLVTDAVSLPTPPVLVTSSNVAWITGAGTTTGTTATLNVAENNTYAVRTGTVTVQATTQPDPGYRGTASMTSAWTISQAANVFSSRWVTINITNVPTVTMSCSSQNDDVLVYFIPSQNQSVITDDENIYVYYFNAGHLEGGEWGTGNGVLHLEIDTTSSIQLTIVASSSTNGPASHSSGTALQTITVPSGTSDYSTSISFAKTFDYSC